MRMFIKIGLLLGAGILLIYLGVIWNFIAIASTNYALGKWGNSAILMGGLLTGFSALMVVARAAAMQHRALIKQIRQKQEVEANDKQSSNGLKIREE